MTIAAERWNRTPTARTAFQSALEQVTRGARALVSGDTLPGRRSLLDHRHDSL